MKIQSIVILDYQAFEVGEMGVKDIIDSSIIKDNCIALIYSVVFDDGSVKKIINCPMYVQYVPKAKYDKYINNKGDKNG